MLTYLKEMPKRSARTLPPKRSASTLPPSAIQQPEGRHPPPSLNPADAAHDMIKTGKAMKQKPVIKREIAMAESGALEDKEYGAGQGGSGGNLTNLPYTPVVRGKRLGVLVSAKDADNLRSKLPHMLIISHGSTLEGRRLIDSVAQDRSFHKAVAAAGKMALHGGSLSKKHAKLMHAFIAEKSMPVRAHMLKGRGFFDALKQAGSWLVNTALPEVGKAVVKYGPAVADAAIKYGPMIAAAL